MSEVQRRPSQQLPELQEFPAGPQAAQVPLVEHFQDVPHSLQIEGLLAQFRLVQVAQVPAWQGGVGQLSLLQ